MLVLVYIMPLHLPSIRNRDSTRSTTATIDVDPEQCRRKKMPTERHGQHQISTTKRIRKPKGLKGGEPTCVDSNGRVRARGVSDGPGYGWTGERAERKDGDGHAHATTNVRGVAEWDEWRADEAHERAGRRAVDDGERDERFGAVHVWPEEGQQACEGDRGHHDVERAWRGGGGSVRC